jgi:hypothetical protein
MPDPPFSFKVELQTSDPSVLVDLFGTELPALGAARSLGEDVTASIEDVQIHHGLMETSILVNFAVTVITGVTTKVIGDLLSDLLKRRKVKLAIDGKQVDSRNAAAIASAIKAPSDVG